MSVTVYSKPACVQCVATYKELEKRGVDHNVIDITKDQDAFAMVQGLGYMQVPVVVAGDDHWGGFRPDKIGTLS